MTMEASARAIRRELRAVTQFFGLPLGEALAWLSPHERFCLAMETARRGSGGQRAIDEAELGVVQAEIDDARAVVVRLRPLDMRGIPGRMPTWRRVALAAVIAGMLVATVALAAWGG